MKIGNKIELGFSVSPEAEPLLENALLPWKLFYPLAENAFKYTKLVLDSNDKEKPEIKLTLATGSSSIIFEIKNTYSPSKSASGSRSGIDNLKKRLFSLYPGKKWQLEHSGIDLIWTSRLHLPLETKKHQRKDE